LNPGCGLIFGVLLKSTHFSRGHIQKNEFSTAVELLIDPSRDQGSTFIIIRVAEFALEFQSGLFRPNVNETEDDI
jgi:hypothetical protein